MLGVEIAILLFVVVSTAVMLWNNWQERKTTKAVMNKLNQIIGFLEGVIRVDYAEMNNRIGECSGKLDKVLHAASNVQKAPLKEDELTPFTNKDGLLSVKHRKEVLRARNGEKLDG